jgi:hypothetical protein
LRAHARDRAAAHAPAAGPPLRVTGTIDRLRVRRRFGRTNGCEIADFARVARALAIRL